MLFDDLCALIMLELTDGELTMLRAQRCQIILDLLKQNPLLETNQALTQLACSAATIRRDFAYLEKQGLVFRIHGGIRLATPNFELTFAEKLKQHLTKKQQIAQKAIQLVKNQMTIYLDAGTTTLQLVKHLPPKITLITNSLNLAQTALESQLEPLLLGGKIKKSTDAMIGQITLNQLQQLHFDLSFIGINGVSQTAGYTTPDPEECFIKKQVLKQSQESYFLADRSKIGQIFLAQVAPFDATQLITDN